jgi:hypothetical protein
MNDNLQSAVNTTAHPPYKNLFVANDFDPHTESSNDAVHSNYENVVEFENWMATAVRVDDSKDFISSKIGPSRTAIWRQLYWISKYWGDRRSQYALSESAEREYIALLVADLPSTQHDSIDRAQLLCAKVFGNYYEPIFNKARAFVGPRNPITEWPTLMAA